MIPLFFWYFINRVVCRYFIHNQLILSQLSGKNAKHWLVLGFRIWGFAIFLCLISLLFPYYLPLRTLHWLPVAARIWFKTLAYHATNSLGPSHIQDKINPYTPAHPLHAATPSLQRGPVYCPTKSWLFAVLAPSIFPRRLKTHLFGRGGMKNLSL